MNTKQQKAIEPPELGAAPLFGLVFASVSFFCGGAFAGNVQGVGIKDGLELSKLSEPLTNLIWTVGEPIQKLGHAGRVEDIVIGRADIGAPATDLHSLKLSPVGFQTGLNGDFPNVSLPLGAIVEDAGNKGNNPAGNPTYGGGKNGSGGDVHITLGMVGLWALVGGIMGLLVNLPYLIWQWRRSR